MFGFFSIDLHTISFTSSPIRKGSGDLQFASGAEHFLWITSCHLSLLCVSRVSPTKKRSTAYAIWDVHLFSDIPSKENAVRYPLKCESFHHVDVQFGIQKFLLLIPRREKSILVVASTSYSKKMDLVLYPLYPPFIRLGVSHHSAHILYFTWVIAQIRQFKQISH